MSLLAFLRILCYTLLMADNHGGSPASRQDPSLALASRLASDEDDLRASLAAPSPPSAGLAPSTLSEARALADRLLIDATPLAVRTLRRIAESGDDKPAVAAASKILDKSPATRDLGPASSLGLTLPPEAFTALVTALSSLASAALQAPPSSPSAPSAPVSDPITVEVLP